MDKEKIKETSKLRLLAKERVKVLQGDSKWSIAQQVLQEIQATFRVERKKEPSISKLRELLITELQSRYKDETEDLKQALIDSVPTRYAISLWLKKPDWKEAIWDVTKVEGLFTTERRSAVIDAMFRKATEGRGDVNAAKVFLTMSGDYSDKLDVKTDATVDKFREINQILQKKKVEE